MICVWVFKAVAPICPALRQTLVGRASGRWTNSNFLARCPMTTTYVS